MVILLKGVCSIFCYFFDVCVYFSTQRGLCCKWIMENSDTSSSNETSEKKVSSGGRSNKSGTSTSKSDGKRERNSCDQDETSHSDGNEVQVVQSSKNANVDHSARSAFGSHCLKNTILDEVLSEKKKALLHSPEVMQFLREKLNK